MPQADKFKVYENNKDLREILERILDSVVPSERKVYMVNISYRPLGLTNEFLSGLEFVTNKRLLENDLTPVVFYGYEALEDLKKAPEAKGLAGPDMAYIHLPIRLDRLKEKISEARSGKAGVPDGKERRRHAVEMARVFKHDLKNSLNTVEIVFKLKRDVSGTTRKDYWKTVRDSLFLSRDLINKKKAQYEILSGELQEVLSKREIKVIGNDLEKISAMYSSLFELLDSYSDRGISSAIERSEKIIENLQAIIAVLEAIQ